jgi:hypothetical protein
VTESNTQPIERAQIEALLARTLGDLRARAVLDDVLHRLAMPAAEAYTLAQVHVLVDQLSRSPGLVGVAGRHARVRLNLAEGASSGDPLASSSERLAASAPPSAPTSEKHAPRPAVMGAPAAGPYVDLLSFFVPALGEEKARDALQHYAKPLKLDANELTREGGIRLLGELVKAEGLLGVVATFANVKFLLRYPG